MASQGFTALPPPTATPQWHSTSGLATKVRGSTRAASHCLRLRAQPTRAKPTRSMRVAASANPEPPQTTEQEVPTAAPVEAGLVGYSRRIVGFGYPFALLWLANRQLPVGDVPGAKSKEEWRALLEPAAYHVLVERGTELAGSSPYDKLYDPGQYNCAACATPLFNAETKFDSGTGWPSFNDPLPGAVDKTLQLLYCLGDFGARECRCHNCGCHLGHVFTDGPKPTGMRYCMNGVALKFVPAGDSQ